MAGDPLWIAASTGAPSYNAREMRGAMAVALQYGGRAVGGYPGVRPGGDQLDVSLSGSDILAEPGCCVVDMEQADESGAYWCAFLTQQAVDTLDARHATLERIDIVYVTVYDDDEDSSGQRTAVCEYLAGTAGSGQPATPAGALLLAAITVPSVADGSPITVDNTVRQFSPAGPTQEEFSSSGTFTKATYPWARMVRVRVQGAGGGGGGAATSGSGTAATGSGGGGGEYVEGWIPVSRLAASETVTINAAGAGGAAGANNGAAGGTAVFGSGVSLLSAAGGGGGTGSSASATLIVGGGSGGTGGATGNAYSDTLRITGGVGGSGRRVGGVPTELGLGGNSHLGQGAQSVLASDSSNGRVGTGFGAGGGGALNRDTGGSTNRAGGAGTGGLVIVEIH